MGPKFYATIYKQLKLKLIDSHSTPSKKGTVMNSFLAVMLILRNRVDSSMVGINLFCEQKKNQLRVDQTDHPVSNVHRDLSFISQAVRVFFLKIIKTDLFNIFESK